MSTRPHTGNYLILTIGVFTSEGPAVGVTLTSCVAPPTHPAPTPSLQTMAHHIQQVSTCRRQEASLSCNPHVYNAARKLVHLRTMTLPAVRVQCELLWVRY
jgi:hypothetical protein